MKRLRDLWPQITEFANLLDAAQKAQKGKRYCDNVLAFNYHREAELLRLQNELVLSGLSKPKIQSANSLPLNVH
jgi:hypothetical protein